MENSIISAIYKGVYELTEDGQMAIHNVSQETSSALELILKNKEDEFIEELMFHISGFSQEIGFVSGFHFAVRLMCECKGLQ